MEALRMFWPCPYPVVEGVDYEVEQIKSHGYLPTFINLMQTLQLRCNYILNMCKNEEEMKGEAKAMLELIDKVLEEALKKLAEN